MMAGVSVSESAGDRPGDRPDDRVDGGPRGGGAGAVDGAGSPPVVSVTLWGIRPGRVPAAFARMGLDRLLLRRTPGLRFAKLVGTGNGRTFALRDADLGHWGLVAAWDDDAALDAFAGSATAAGWDRLSGERLDVRMTPLASRGRWAGREPFGPAASAPGHTPGGPDLPRPPGGSGAVDLDGPVAAITRARLRPTRAASFWRAVPAAAADLAESERDGGLRLAVGIGESPLGWFGTFSVWSSLPALSGYAFRRSAHRDVMRRTGPERWYAEELFARFAVRSITGTYRGRDPLAERSPSGGEAGGRP